LPLLELIKTTPGEATSRILSPAALEPMLDGLLKDLWQRPEDVLIVDQGRAFG
jgi:hypothetical protein